MGLLEKIFHRPERAEAAALFKTLTAYSPVFTSWSGELYESELVRAAIHARATHISKLKIQISGSAQPELSSRLLRAPNDWQTWSQFLYRLSTILDVQNTAFIVPVEDGNGRTTGIYPILPSSCELVETQTGEFFVRYQFSGGGRAAVEFARLGILTKMQYRDDFFGESNAALSPTMELVNMQNQAISEGVKSSATYRFMAQVNNIIKPEDITKERKRFTRENLENGDGGLLLFPNSYSNIKQLVASPFVVDNAQMQRIETNVHNYFGTNENVIQNKAFGDSWNAFYEGAIEPFAIQLSEALTKMIYTAREQSFGAGIMATSNRLQYMSNADKLSVSSQMADRGIMNRDEIREIWNLPPLPNGQGQAYTIRGEYYIMDENGNYRKAGAENGDV